MTCLVTSKTLLSDSDQEPPTARFRKKHPRQNCAKDLQIAEWIQVRQYNSIQIQGSIHFPRAPNSQLLFLGMVELKSVLSYQIPKTSKLLHLNDWGHDVQLSLTSMLRYCTACQKFIPPTALLSNIHIKQERVESRVLRYTQSKGFGLDHFPPTLTTTSSWERTHLESPPPSNSSMLTRSRRTRMDALSLFSAHQKSRASTIKALSVLHPSLKEIQIIYFHSGPFGAAGWPPS